MDSRIADALAQAYLDKTLNLSAEDLSKAVIFIVNYHVRTKDKGLGLLSSAYGTTAESDRVKLYSTSLFNGVVDNDKKSQDLFWDLFNLMTSSLMIESVNESLRNTTRDLDFITE